MTKNVLNINFVKKCVICISAFCTFLFTQAFVKDALAGREFVTNRNHQSESKHILSQTTSYTLAFADLEDDDEDLTDEDLEEFSKYEKSMEKRDNVMGGAFEELKDAKGYESELDGKEDDFASLEILENVGKAINEAKTYHNMKQMLPEYRKTFQDLKDARDYHDKTVEYLQQSEECIVRYLSPHYGASSKTWFGNNCDFFGNGTIYCHYSPEKELDDNSESSGLYDDKCPDDAEHLCFIKNIEKNEYKTGIGGLLLGYYNQGKEDDALQETQVYLAEDEEEPEATVEETSDNEYTAQVDIESDVPDSSVDENVYVSERNDTGLMDTDNANASDVVPSMESTKSAMKSDEVSEQDADENVKDTKKAEALAEETRKEHLMNWVWGAQVASDISKDLDSSYSRFGDKIKAFPLWNDQKEFYNQYIDGKYENIKVYVQKAPMPNALMTAAKSINKKFSYEPIVIKNSEGKKKVEISAKEIKDTIAKALSSVNMSKFKEKDTVKSSVDKIISAESKKLNDLKAQHERKIALLKSRKETLENQLGQTNSDLSATNDEVNKNSEVIASSVNTDRATEENEESNRNIKEIYKNDVDVSDSPMNKKFAKEKEESDVNKNTAKKERDKGLKKADNLEKKSKDLSDKLKKVKEELENERRNFVKTYAAMEEKIRNGFSDELEKVKVPEVSDSDVVSEMTKAIEKASKTLSTKFKESIALPITAATLSGEMITCLREEAAKIAEETKVSMDKLKGDETIYYNSNARQVQGIHKNMISKMKSISSCGVGGVSSAPIAKDVFGDMCDEVKCLKVDTDKNKQGLKNYFVGAIPLKDDLKIPTPPVDFSSAPMREIFHLDLTDYDNMEKYYEEGDDLSKNANITISADGFLNSGLEIPLIWKYILQLHPYGHKQFDLVRLLGNKEFGDDVRGDPDKAYIRSGSFPCYIGSSVIDASGEYSLKRSGAKWELVVDKFGYSINKTKDIHAYNKVTCKGLSIKGGKVIDYAVDASPPGRNFSSDLKGLVSETSELGTVLAYIPNSTMEDGLDVLFPNGKHSSRKLTFNASMQKAIGIISESEDINDDKEKEAQFYLANRTLFERNQFGDFLNQYEQESYAGEALMKIENQIDEILNNLRDIFYGTNMIISDGFDLLNDADYKAAASALDEQKNIYINKAQKEIQKVKGFTDLVKYRTEQYLHSIAVLMADSDELVQVSGGEDLSELEAKIKNKQADNAVADKYDEEGRVAQERRIRQLQPPYCEVHPYK